MYIQIEEIKHIKPLQKAWKEIENFDCQLQIVRVMKLDETDTLKDSNRIGLHMEVVGEDAAQAIYNLGKYLGDFRNVDWCYTVPDNEVNT